ncbi:MAG: AraC family transcriptional regulator [Lachnospiraceae bacterium]|nr:AraC family transcriptional regulator [Lachnospiraceae bacterium]
MILLELKDDRSEKVQYENSDYPIYIRKGLLSANPNYSAPSHWHDDIEFIAVLSGEMQYNVNGEIITLKENDGIVVNARQLHFGFSSEKKECKFICILLHPLLLCTISAYERDFVLPVLHNKNAVFIKLNTAVLWKKNILEEIKYMYVVKDDKIAPMKVQSSFVKIWTLIYENIPLENNPKAQNTDLTIIKNMIGFIQQNYTYKISLSDIAASGAVGQSKCCKLFGKYLSQTPNTYLTQYRLDKSAELLKTTEMTITEITDATGFNGSSYYAETFRKWIGVSPTDYRNAN